MTTQSEATLEQNLIKQLQNMEYERVEIHNQDSMLSNLKAQLETHNNIKLSDSEFSRVLNHLDKGNVFDRAKILRDKMHLSLDDGKSAYLEFINMTDWCKNQFQVTNQFTQEGAYKNRYDVTILINGLPLVQIELKRRGLELKEAFNQINRYHRHSFDASHGLFQYVQIFIISNGVNTKYYANNRGAGFKQTFFWADKENRNITKLDEFTDAFLEKCHLAKMITKYTVLAEATQSLMVLRPYQYYAVEAIIDRVENSKKNGYIWHTTGSGKTLTSFKASQILIDIPKVDKVVFVVDRNDLDYQTIKEFNSFKQGSVDGTDNTRQLVKQFASDDRLIVTTIQKLNNAISHQHHEEQMAPLKSKNIIFIFDECHRSQFGETHKKITEFFESNQMFGFTGTPIFADNAMGNALGKRTTKDLFTDCLHKYVITDAIKDENVLRFSVEYYNVLKPRKDGTSFVDIEVEDIDTEEVMSSPQRLETIADFIIAHHDIKTHSRKFNAIFATSNIDTLTKYYDIFKSKQEEGQHNLKIATIFSYNPNEEDKGSDGFHDDMSDDQLSLGALNKHSRDKLEGYIADYNAMFGSSFTTKDSNSFYNYYKDVAKKVKNNEIDILLVVNMFLTGFDSKRLNTMYIDKNLRHHGLIQAYSRTNRTAGDQKSQGNIVVFRNLKKATDEAIALFSNKDAQEVIFIEPYSTYVGRFNQALAELHGLTATASDVDSLEGEEEQLNFVTKFRELMRLKNILVSFTDFSFDDIGINEQDFEDFKSKYLDIYDKVRSDHDKEKVSILEDIDFELELIRRDEINVDYIVRLLAKLVDASEEKKDDILKSIMGMLSSDATLRSKRELIEKFIAQNIPEIDDPEQVDEDFDSFWKEEQLAAFEKICQEEGLDPDETRKIIDSYLFTDKKPRRKDLASALKEQPAIIERDSIITRINSKLSQFIETFIDGV